MKKCILCDKEHEGGCDKSEWDGVLKAKFNVPEVTFPPNPTKDGGMYWIEQEEAKALKEEEHNHIVKKRGRPRRA